MTDTLPTDAGTSWTINGGTAAGSCTILLGVLTCNLGDLASGQVRTVHITSPTTPATVPDSPVSNTASVTTTNDGSDTDTDQVVVLGPDLQVVKSADNSPISAGESAAWTITVTNIGQGIARASTLTDTLPAGIVWTTQTQGCSITGGVLSCSFGDLAAGAVRTVKVSGETDADDCHELPNSATASSTNEPATLLTNNTGSASITVDCPAVTITKTPVDPEVNATDGIAFDVEVTNTGVANAFAVTVNDPLPTDAGLSWTIDAANSDAGWTIEAGVLKFGPSQLAVGASTTVRIVSPTTPATCPSVHNVAFLTYLGGSGDDDGRHPRRLPGHRGDEDRRQQPDPRGRDGLVHHHGQQHRRRHGLRAVTLRTCCRRASTGRPRTRLHHRGRHARPATSATSVPTIRRPSSSRARRTRSRARRCANTASASSTNEPSTLLDNNRDGDEIDVLCPSIDLVKTAGNAADGAILTIPVPGDVVFTYLVTNTGSADLTDIALVDDNATPANTADDITVICPETFLAAGDIDDLHGHDPGDRQGHHADQRRHGDGGPARRQRDRGQRHRRRRRQGAGPGGDAAADPEDHPAPHQHPRRGRPGQLRQRAAPGPPRHRRAHAGPRVPRARTGPRPESPTEPEGLGPSCRGRSTAGPGTDPAA